MGKAANKCEDSGTSEKNCESNSLIQEPKIPASILSPLLWIKRKYHALSERMEKYLPFLSVGCFVLGIFIAKWSSTFANAIDSGISSLIDFYGWIAPLAIYMILAPSLSRMVNSTKGEGGKFVLFAIYWLSVRRLIACVFGALFTAVVFGFPLSSGKYGNLSVSVFETLKSLGWMMTHSIYFYAMYASVLTVCIAMKSRTISAVLQKCAELVEILGQYFVPIVPLFMLAIGSYVYFLPTSLAEQLGGDQVIRHLKSFNLWGLSISTHSAWGMVGVYIVSALLTGLGCFIWHLGLLAWTKGQVPQFSIWNYFTKYWIRVYPLLWSTSSEALATPLNLYLVKKYYPEIRRSVRRFIIGVGSYIDINGTMICVFVLAGAVAKILGIDLSVIQLLCLIPLVFMIGFGVPGIPGELLLFGGPVVMLLAIPSPMDQVFLTLYLGLQIGLPDSFRTGNNSTDSCVLGILMNRIYEKRFLREELNERDSRTV